MWEPRRLTTLGGSTACYRDSFYLFCIIQWNYWENKTPSFSMAKAARTTESLGTNQKARDRRVSYTGIQHRVSLWKSTDVSEEQVASVLRVEVNGQRKTSVGAGRKLWRLSTDCTALYTYTVASRELQNLQGREAVGSWVSHGPERQSRSISTGNLWLRNVNFPVLFMLPAFVMFQ
jgi:hypothetical protein